jgi:hypothetical protein
MMSASSPDGIVIIDNLGSHLGVKPIFDTCSLRQWGKLLI